MMTTRTSKFVLLIVALLSIDCCSFAPASTITATQITYETRFVSYLRLASTSVGMVNPLKKLPWNVQKEREREARRLKTERNKLFRELGITEDATYEEIVVATDNLIAAAGKDVKQKIKIEIAKDKILQIRLNERVKGLTKLTKEARAQSAYELRGMTAEDEDDKKSKTTKDPGNGPKWMQGLVVKPDTKHLNYQLKLWGLVTAIGVALPPVQSYLVKFNWLICVAQLIYRGMPAEERERGGMGLNFSGGGGGGHRKVSFLLGFGIWIVGSALIYGLMPTWVRGQRWEGSLVYLLQNSMFLLASCYLQPYKGSRKQVYDD